MCVSRGSEGMVRMGNYGRGRDSRGAKYEKERDERVCYINVDI